MDINFITNELGRNANVFRELLFNSDADLIRWRHGPGKWNLLEIICHLYDEEREDFRARLKHVLEGRDEPLPSIDPPGWVQSRNYDSQNFEDKIEGFISERKKSVEWLRSLEDPKLDNFYEHPKFGKMTGNMFLSNWLAHDFLHIRQIVRVKYFYLQMISGEMLDYAGPSF